LENAFHWLRKSSVLAIHNKADCNRAIEMFDDARNGFGRSDIIGILAGEAGRVDDDAIGSATNEADRAIGIHGTVTDREGGGTVEVAIAKFGFATTNGANKKESGSSRHRWRAGDMDF
jgi:hypothetical protein